MLPAWDGASSMRSWQDDWLMQRSLGVLRCVVGAWLAVSAGCSGSGKSTPASAGSAQPTSRELDKLMRTRMNAAYSQLIFLVFHAEGERDFPRISDESTRLSDAI